MAPRKLFTIEKVAVDPKKSAKAKAAAKGKKGAVAAAGWCIPSPGGGAGCAHGAGPAWLLADGARPEGMLLPCEGSEGEGPGVHRRLEEEGRWGAQDACQAMARRVQPRPWWRRAVPCPPEKRKAKRKAGAAKRAAKKKAAAAKKAEKAKAKKAKKAAKKAAKAAKKARGERLRTRACAVLRSLRSRSLALARPNFVAARVRGRPSPKKPKKAAKK